jgi:hypothetical protein
METIFNTQIVRLILSTGIDLSTATSLQVVYRAPGNSKGIWSAQMDPNDHTRMIATLNSLEPGTWEVYGKAFFPSGPIPGRKVIFTIDRE